jgi:hypothetical protein
VELVVVVVVVAAVMMASEMRDASAAQSFLARAEPHIRV